MISLAFVKGLGAGGALIVAIGAQNVFVLRHGIRREQVLAVVTVCALSDACLILLGRFGIGAALRDRPALLEAARWGGAGLLLVYGAWAAKRAFTDRTMVVRDQAPGGAWTTIAAGLGFAFLNPHCWLDTVVLLGTMTSQQAEGSRGAFSLGAMSASVLWFFGLGYGARVLAPAFARPRAWKVLDAGVALVMWSIAASLLWPR